MRWLIERRGLPPIAADDRHHAPALVVGMRHFYEFLNEQRLVDEKVRDASHAVCRTLWSELKRRLQRDWPRFACAARYWPEGADQ